MSRRVPALGAPTRAVALVLVLAAALAGCATRPYGPSLPPAAAEDEPAEPTAPVPKPPRPAPPATPAAPEPAGPPPRIADGRTLFDRLAAGFTPPVCVRGEHNRAWRRRYAGHPAAFERQLRQSMPLLGYVVEAVEARDLPTEFALIPIVESGYRPDARGPGGPTGLWQMIGSTARNHGVRVGRGYDGRLSPVDSTDAALDYLAALHAEFGDWRATAMAYNAGEGRLRRAFAREGARRVSGERRLPAGLSSVTYAYVAKLHALACLVAEPGRHGLSLPTETFTPLEARAAPDGLTRLDAVAARWAVDATALRALNPAHRNGLAAGAPRRLLVPIDANGAASGAPGAGVASAQRAGTEHGSASAAPDSAPREHVVARGDTLWRIARRYGTSVRAIAEANGLDAKAALRVGRRLRLPD